jgi:pimeloyl-ACP methyl ester carboxylesterase
VATPAPERTAQAPRRLPAEEFELKEIELHGHRVAYRCAGSGPAILLVHGITSTSATWERVMPYLARQFTVIAPDLIGHGESAKPRGDYSLGAYASGVRDLMVSLGHESATFVGHSLGGGVVMQLAYQFPERCERLVLVDSGGLGREVNILLRAAALPLSELALTVGGLLGKMGISVATDLGELGRGHASLEDPEARSAFLHTLRTIVDPMGQRVNATDRLYLAENIPFMLVWGERDRIIPVEHGLAAHELVPSSRLEVFEDTGHFPHLDDPLRFVDVLLDFIESTDPADVDPEDWRKALKVGRRT